MKLMLWILLWGFPLFYLFAAGPVVQFPAAEISVPANQTEVVVAIEANNPASGSVKVPFTFTR